MFQLQQMPPFINGDSQTNARGLIGNYIHPNQYWLPTGKSTNVVPPNSACLIALELVLSTQFSSAICDF